MMEPDAELSDAPAIFDRAAGIVVRSLPAILYRRRFVRGGDRNSLSDRFRALKSPKIGLGGNREDLPALYQRRICRSRQQRVVRVDRSLSRRTVGEDPARVEGRCRQGRQGGQRGDVAGPVVEDDGVGARQGHAQARRSRRRECRASCRDRGAGQRQADGRDAGTAALPSGMVVVFRRAGRQARGRTCPDRQAGNVRLHDA